MRLPSVFQEMRNLYLLPKRVSNEKVAIIRNRLLCTRIEINNVAVWGSEINRLIIQKRISNPVLY